MSLMHIGPEDFAPQSEPPRECIEQKSAVNTPKQPTYSEILAENQRLKATNKQLLGILYQFQTGARKGIR